MRAWCLTSYSRTDSWEGLKVLCRNLLELKGECGEKTHKTFCNANKLPLFIGAEAVSTSRVKKIIFFYNTKSVEAEV